MEKEKYYTPEISEFHVFFEYEWKCDGTQTDWTKSICNEKMNPLDVDCRRVNEYRVKYLDKEDIESFQFYQKIGYYLTVMIEYNGKKNVEIHLVHTGKQILIYIYNEYTLYAGECLNKSELKFILKRLKIISNG